VGHDDLRYYLSIHSQPPVSALPRLVLVLFCPLKRLTKTRSTRGRRTYHHGRDRSVRLNVSDLLKRREVRTTARDEKSSSAPHGLRWRSRLRTQWHTYQQKWWPCYSANSQDGPTSHLRHRQVNWLGTSRLDIPAGDHTCFGYGYLAPPP
jgi:hypothetical protein